MDIVQIARSRYACKAYDKTRTISNAQLHELLEVLRLTPSAVNSQPWHFVVVGTDAGKERVAEAMAGVANKDKVLAASHTIVFCIREPLHDDYLKHLIEQEIEDGRFINDQMRQMQDEGRRFLVGFNSKTPMSLRSWEERQLYIALGFLLYAAAAINIDTTAIEGLMTDVLDRQLELPQQGLHSVVAVTLGYHSEEDFNAVLPKSRLPTEEVFTFL